MTIQEGENFFTAHGFNPFPNAREALGDIIQNNDGAAYSLCRKHLPLLIWMKQVKSMDIGVLYLDRVYRGIGADGTVKKHDELPTWDEWKEEEERRAARITALDVYNQFKLISRGRRG